MHNNFFGQPLCPGVTQITFYHIRKLRWVYCLFSIASRKSCVTAGHNKNLKTFSIRHFKKFLAGRLFCCKFILLCYHDQALNLSFRLNLKKKKSPGDALYRSYKNYTQIFLYQIKKYITKYVYLSLDLMSFTMFILVNKMILSHILKQ